VHIGLLPIDGKKIIKNENNDPLIDLLIEDTGGHPRCVEVLSTLLPPQLDDDDNFDKIDEICSIGLIRWNAATHKLQCAYVWLYLFVDNNDDFDPPLYKKSVLAKF
jgi:hypothetical protein